MKTRRAKRIQRKLRIKAKIRGTDKRPRLVVFRSHQALYVQVINDKLGLTIVSGYTKGVNKPSAEKLAQEMVKKIQDKKIINLVFDRGGYKYHGVIKELAEAMRKGGLKF